ncbi:aminoglycoside N(3)-acetyltransferase [Jeotgalibacillus soli]|uniref:Aminoglycoside N(3)-acetyltransferase n=1 Tax=Jeotgalibacillus soli TaxID=889306 RepID=A0A0C2RUS9_9BACL|nr:AAC(3) family N-acetyltransferase [Jeotgalibacillus soli]KIL45484.1 hypothetical protein KP78_30280 [Jeotgalibacillus soli]
MSENSVIKQTLHYQSYEQLLTELKTLGVHEGMTIIVHSSLTRLGWVAGGETTMVKLLQESVSRSGTIVMPAQTPGNSDPSMWENPPIPEEWWDKVRADIPPFDEKASIPRGMGRIAECFCALQETKRSSHPMHSFTALGPKAEWITESHPLEDSFGPQSPLGKLYNDNAFVLLLGVGYGNATCLHLSEALQEQKTWYKQHSAIWIEGKRKWVSYDQLSVDSDIFPTIGLDFEKSHHIQQGMVGNAHARLIPIKELVDFGFEWIKHHREKS